MPAGEFPSQALLDDEIHSGTAFSEQADVHLSSDDEKWDDVETEDVAPSKILRVTSLPPRRKSAKRDRTGRGDK